MKFYEEQVRLTALKAQKHFLEGKLNEENKDRELVELMLEHVRRLEMAITNRMKYRMVVTWILLKRIIRRAARIFAPNQIESRFEGKRNKVRELKIRMAEAAIEAIKQERNSKNNTAAHTLISDYHKLIERLKQGNNRETREKAEKELQYIGFHAERETVQNLYEKGEITRDIANKIRKEITLREALMIEENEY
jgi:CPA1 family monovalent cation:H+ antiporter